MAGLLDIRDFIQFIDDLVSSALEELIETSSLIELEKTNSKYLGRRSKILEILKELKNQDDITKRQRIPIIQKARGVITSRVKDRANDLKSAQPSEEAVKNNYFDPTSPIKQYKGSRHPVALIIREVSAFFRRCGFSVTRGPEIESNYYNFTGLNFPNDHPALEKKESFWLDSDRLLRTHTSGVQIRMMEQNTPPMMVISSGRVYRPDSDATHTPMFHQIEGFLVAEKIDLGHLKGLLYSFLRVFLKEDRIEIRFRPSYFPFTVPSAEIDVKISKTCKWLEILGCGIIHPNILRKHGLDTNRFQGLAFGMGIERLAMIKYGLKDLRALYENDTRFLEEFSNHCPLI